MAEARIRSPIRESPLRQAGQSLNEEIERIEIEEISRYVFIAAIILAMIVLEWLNYITDAPNQPMPVTVVGVVVIGYSIHRVQRARRARRKLVQGWHGERTVGEEIDQLRAQGWAVFHDMPGNNFNLDHVILSQKGIFVVETKTWSKPKKAAPKLIYDGKRLTIEGWRSYTDPIVQAEAEARWLKDVLKKSTGKDYPVKTAIVFPGWFVEQRISTNKTKVWAINPKGLKSFIENEKVQIKEEDLHLAAFHIGRYVRVANSNGK